MLPCHSINRRICFNITFEINIRSFTNSISLNNRICAELEFYKRRIYHDHDNGDNEKERKNLSCYSNLSLIFNIYTPMNEIKTRKKKFQYKINYVCGCTYDVNLIWCHLQRPSREWVDFQRDTIGTFPGLRWMERRSAQSQLHFHPWGSVEF